MEFKGAEARKKRKLQTQWLGGGAASPEVGLLLSVLKFGHMVVIRA
jgi:hypothetical protein